MTTEASIHRPLTLAAAHAFTRDDYHAMLAAGILGEDDRVELISGQIINQMPIGTLHASVVGRLTMLLAARVQDRAVVWVQNPIALDAINEPEPDVALLRPRADFYADVLPAPDDVLLVIVARIRFWWTP